MKNELLNIVNLSIRIGDAQVLTNVSFSLFEQEYLGIIGLNGVGKSVLAQVLTGSLKPTSGSIMFRGKHMSFNSPIDAIELGINYIGEATNLLPNLTVAENLLMGNKNNQQYFISQKKNQRKAKDLLKCFGFKIDEKQIVRNLCYSDMKKLQLVRQLSSKPQVLILDEFMDAFSNYDQNIIYEILSEFRKLGLAIIHTTKSHKNIYKHCSRMLMMDKSLIVAEFENPLAEVEKILLLEGQLQGQDPLPANNNYTKDNKSRVDTVLEVKHLSAGKINDLSFSMVAGEVLGIIGNNGVGKSDIARCLGGLIPIEAGQIILDGERLIINSPQDAKKRDICICYEKRMELLLNGRSSILKNISVSALEKISRRGVVHAVFF